MHQSSAGRAISSGLRAALLLTLLLASALRLLQLDVLPPGLFFDEAFNGLDAVRILSGDQFPLFFVGNSGREPLFIYLQTLSVMVFGRSPFSLRLVAAFIGILTVPLVYAAGRWILPRVCGDDERIASSVSALPALITAAGLAVLFWHVSLSRLGFRAVLLPLTSVLAIALFWRGWSHGRSRDYLWSGFWLAMAMYTYLAARMLPVVILVFLTTELAVDFRRHSRSGELLWSAWRRRLNGLAKMSLIALLLSAPMFLTLLREPALLATRVSDVSLFTSDDSEHSLAYRGAENALAVVRSLYLQGDENLRHNLPGRPVNDWLLGGLLIAGLVTALVQIRQPHARLLLIWLVIMTLPAMLSTRPVHSLRSAGMLPPMVLLYGLGAWGLVNAGTHALAHNDERRFRSAPRGSDQPEARCRRIAGVGMAVLWLCVVVISGGASARDYFIRWSGLRNLPGYFQLDHQLAAEWTGDWLSNPEASPILVSRRLFLQPQMGYALGRVYLENSLPAIVEAGEAISGELPALVDTGPDGQEPMFLVWREGEDIKAAQVDPPADKEGRAAIDISASAELRSPAHREGWPGVRIGVLRPGAQLRPSIFRYPLAISFANGIKLVGYDVKPDAVDPRGGGQTLRLHLFFQFEDPSPSPDRSILPGRAGARLNDFDIFAHLVMRGGVVLTANGPIGEHVPYWLSPGSPKSGPVIFEDIRRFALPDDMQDGKAFFEAGLYSYRPAQAATTFDRIAVVNQHDQPIADALTLGGVFIGHLPEEGVAGYAPLNAMFEDQIELTGWCLERDPTSPSKIRVGLAWRGLDRPTQDYTAFVHLLDQDGQMIAQYDRPPGEASNPTHLWAPGETIRTYFPLGAIGSGELDGARLRIGLYDPISGRRLPVTLPGQDSDVSARAEFVVLPAGESACP